MTPEGRVKAKLKKELAKWGYWNFWPVQTGYGAAIVDCLAIQEHGRLVAIECKREGIQEPTPRQAMTMRNIRMAGGLTYLVTMRDRELVWLEQKD